MKTRWTEKEAPAVYEWTGPTGVLFRDIREPSGCYYHDTTPRDVVRLLEDAKTRGARVRLFYGDRVTGRDWLEEHDVCGRIGQSTGPIAIALMIPSRRSSGGPGLLPDCIVRLIVDGCEVYRHPKYRDPVFVVRPIGPEEKAHVRNGAPAKSLLSLGYTHAVDVKGRKDGRGHANFRSEASALRWVAFMQGKRGAK